MLSLLLVGIGTGNPDHLTLQAIRAINRADLVLVPRKGEDKADLATLRKEILAEILTNPATIVAEFDVPVRDETIPDYKARVEAWHGQIAGRWQDAIDAHLPSGAGCVALLVWGDPTLYDSTLRIAGRLQPPPTVTVIPGITAISALAAAHGVPVNALGAPFLVTTGRRLRDDGWPQGVDTLVVMLDAGGAFTALPPAGIGIWWGAYLGMAEEITLAGPLAEVGAEILARRAEARARHGWIMDIYILRRNGA